MRFIALAAVAATTIATPAFAQDAETPGFAGPHVELIAGWDRVEVPGMNVSGGAAGIGLGYDLQFGPAVIGIEGEAADSTTKYCESYGSQSICLSGGRDLYIGGRIGATVTDNTMLYAKVGYTSARMEMHYTDMVYDVDVKDGENLDGIRFGAGVEHNFGKVLTRLEYRYSNYEQDFERNQVVVGVGLRF